LSRNPKDKPTAGSKTARFNDVKFVNWSLTSAEKTACKEWLVVDGDVDNALLTFIEEGNKVTCSYDSFRFCFTASLIPADELSPNKGYILTGKGSTPLKAIKQALFINYRIMDGLWATYSTATNSEELDD